VPEKSPTVRGLVALIVLGMNGMTVGEALAMPIDLLPVLKLDKVLGMQRRQGVRGVMQRIHSEIHRQVAGAPASP
jgi:cysteine desulfuration protein SufE